MSQLLRVSCPECEATLRVPELEDDEEVVTCPKCGAEFSPDVKPTKRGKAAPVEDDEEEEETPRKPRKDKRNKEEAGSGQTILIAAIIVVAVIASIAAIAVPLMMKKKDDGNSQASTPPSSSVTPSTSTGPGGMSAMNPGGMAGMNPGAMPPGAMTAQPGAAPLAMPPGTMMPPATPPGMNPGAVAINPMNPMAPPNALPGTNPAALPGSNPIPKPAGLVVTNPANPAGSDVRTIGPGPGQNQVPPKPPVDLKRGKTLIAGSWESSVVNPSNKITNITSIFNANGTYSSVVESGGKKVDSAGTWEMAVQGENYLVVIVASAIKDGKPFGKPLTIASPVRFNGDDTLIVGLGQGQAFTRK